MVRWRLVAGVALVGLALGACADRRAGAGTPDPGDLGPMSAEQAFAAREPLTSCGEVALDQGEQVPDEAWACLDDAADDVGAELVVTRPTVEGDPVVSHYRRGPGIAGMEVFRDTRADCFAAAPDRRWWHEVCPATTRAAEPAGCVGAVYD